MSKPTVQLVEAPSPEVATGLANLLPQVSSRAEPLSADRLALVLQNPATQVFVARIDDEVVGMALLLIHTTLTGRSGYVEEVAVDPNTRGKRVGTALMQALLEHAAHLDLHFVDLTSRPSRAAANRLYQSVGFTLRETNCYRFDRRPTPDSAATS